MYSCDNKRVVLTRFLHSKNCMPALCDDPSDSASGTNTSGKDRALACEVDDPPIITDVGPMEKCIDFESCGHGDQDQKDCGAVYYDCSGAQRTLDTTVQTKLTLILTLLAGALLTVI